MELRQYQKDGVDFLLRNARCLLADDPGLGKSAQAICAATKITPRPSWRELGLPHRKPRVLVLCPKSVVLNWANEIKMWDKSQKVKWQILNWDRLLNLSVLTQLSSQMWDAVICDESQKGIKSWEAKRCRNFFTYVEPRSSRLWFLTATPATKSASDYHPLMTAIFGKDKVLPYNKFCDKYCEKKYNPWARKEEPYGFKNTGPIKKAFKLVSLKRKTSEVAPELPRIRFNKIKIDIGDEFKIDDSVTMDAINGLVEEEKTTKPIATMVKEVGLAKVEAAIEWIDNFPLNESLVIFAWHQEVIAKLVSGLLPENPFIASITGRTTLKKRQELINAFQKGELKRLILNMDAGGIGINLHKAWNALYVELPWSPDKMIQSMGRIRRLGSTAERVLYHQLIARGTVDDLILKAVRAKQRGIKGIGV